MTARVTAAMEEAYASAPRGATIIDVLSVDHDGWDAPLHLALGIEAPLAVTLEDGSSATLNPCAFEITPPGFSDQGPTPGRVSIDNVSGHLVEPFDEAIEPGTPIVVTYRTFRSDDLSAPGDVILGLRLREAELSATSAEGELDFEQVSDQAFPRQTYTLGEYPSLWSGG